MAEPRKWKKYYNLPEIERIRKLIKDSYSNKLQFIEESHQYFLDGVEFTCVSDMVTKWSSIDEEAMLDNCAQKAMNPRYPNYKYHGMTKDEIKAQWDEIKNKACTFGTSVHAFGESMFYYMAGQDDKILPECKDKFDENGPKPSCPQEEAIVKFWNDIPETIIPVLAETKVFNTNTAPYAGTFDILFYYYNEKNPEKSGLMIFDYKGLDVNTPIFTTSGWKTMGSIETGDVVYDCDGNETTVLNVSDVHMNPCYKINFNNGESVIADHEHKWVINFWRKQDNKKSKVMTTEEIYNFMQENPNRGDTINIPKILCAKGFGSYKDLLIDPYVLGVWLGDGSSACGIVTNMYDEIFDEIRKRGYQVGNDVSHGASGKAQMRTILGLSEHLRTLNLIDNKHIPSIYLSSSFEQKLDLLRGIMDADGYYNPKRKRFVLVTTKESQKDFCVELLSSLGIKCTVIKAKKYCEDKVFNGFDVCFTSDFYPFLVRKIEVEKPKTDCHSFYNIKKIEKVDTVPTRCIEVDSPTHTYLFGKHFIPTHNTNVSLSNDYARSIGQMMNYPFNDLYEESLSHYYLQLSFYQYPMEQLGLKVIGRRLIHVKDDGTYDKVKVPNMVGRIKEALDIKDDISEF